MTFELKLKRVSIRLTHHRLLVARYFTTRYSTTRFARMTSNYPLTDDVLPVPGSGSFIPWESVEAHAWAYDVELSMAIDPTGPSRWIGTHDAYKHLFRKILTSVVLSRELLEDPELTLPTFVPRQVVHALIGKVAIEVLVGLTGKALAKIHILTEKIVGRYLFTCRSEKGEPTSASTLYEMIGRLHDPSDSSLSDPWDFAVERDRLEGMEPVRTTPKPVAAYEITRNYNFLDTISFRQDSGKVSLIEVDTRSFRERLCELSEGDLPQTWRLDIAPDAYIETDGQVVTWCDPGSDVATTPDNESFRYLVNYAVHRL